MCGTDDLGDRQRRDFEDSQNEIAGREVGRRSRFLTREDDRTSEGKRRRRVEEALRRTLDILLHDPIYRAKYDAAEGALARAERATETALSQLAALVMQVETDLQELQNRAARLPDGTRVYRDQSGVVRREDGSVVDDTLAATILWTGNEPRYEDFIEHRDRLGGLHRDQAEVATYQTDVLGDTRHRLSDEENPPSLEELDAITDRINASMPDIVRAIVTTEQPETTPTPVTADMVPTLGN